jgi:hypothetical protein
MQTEALAACHDRMLLLLDRTDAAIDRQDMDALCRYHKEAACLTAEMEALSREAIGSFGENPLAGQAVSHMEGIIRKTLSRLGDTQARATRWVEETGRALSRLNQGATAVRTYASPLRAPALFADRQV